MGSSCVGEHAADRVQCFCNRAAFLSVIQLMKKKSQLVKNIFDSLSEILFGTDAVIIMTYRSHMNQSAVPCGGNRKR